MLFASRELVAGIERAECDLLRDAVRSVAELRPERDARAIPLAGGVATWTGEGSPLNKVAGLGFDGAPSPAGLEAVERFYASRECPVQVELSTLASPDVAPLLTRRGYRLVGFENVLGRDQRVDERSFRTGLNSGLDVEQADDQGFALWLVIVQVHEWTCR